MYSCFRPKDNFHTIHNEVLTMISLDAVVTYEALFSGEKKKGLDSVLADPTNRDNRGGLVNYLCEKVESIKWTT